MLFRFGAACLYRLEAGPNESVMNSQFLSVFPYQRK
jgi:hypothetical protein